MIITYTTLGRSIKRRVITSYRTKEENKYLFNDWENVIVFKKGEQIFRTQETVGSSGGKRIEHFRYIGDLMDYVEKRMLKKLDVGYKESYEKYREIARAIMMLKEGKAKRILINRSGTIKVEGP